MDGYSGTPPTPPYSSAPIGSSAGSIRPPLPPSSAAAATGNPSGSLARGLFMAPRVVGAQPTVATGPIPPQRQKKAAAKRPVVAAAVAAATQKKERKGGAPAKIPRGPLHQAPAAQFDFPAPQSTHPQANFAAPEAVPELFDELTTSVDNEILMDTMNVSSNNYEEEEEKEPFDDEGEGLIEPPKGRSVNYTVAEDVLLYKTWCNVSMDATVGTNQNRDTYWARMKEYFDRRNKGGIEQSDRSLRSRWSSISTDCQKWVGCVATYDACEESGGNDATKLSTVSNMYRGEGKTTKRGNLIKGKPFTLFHCYKVLENEEKWKNRDVLQVPNQPYKETYEAQKIDEDDATSGDSKRSATPCSIPKSKRPMGRKQAKDAKKKAGGEDDLTKVVVAIADARRETTEERKKERTMDMATEARKAAVEERRLALEEKVAMEENQRLMEEEKKFMFMDTSNLDARALEYINMCRDQILAQKRMSMGAMGGMGGMGGMEGMGGFGGMGGYGAPPGGMGGYGGLGAPTSGYVPTSSEYGGFGGMNVTPGGFMAAMMNMGGYGAPGGMGITGDAQAHVDEHAQGQVDEGKEDGEEKEMDDEEDEA